MRLQRWCLLCHGHKATLLHEGLMVAALPQQLIHLHSSDTQRRSTAHGTRQAPTAHRYS